ncbi:MAG TPA: TonB-dependent receptor [Deltaproteobacteria bacterium]|nr:TonB-dependent receptor [Deltaproteobacteria bacterium]
MNWNVNSLYLMVMGIFILVAGTLTCQAAQQPEVFELGEVVVSATPLSGVEQVTVVREVDAEQIENSGAKTLNEAIALLPGVTIRTGNQGVPRIDIRGLRTRHVILLLDGIPLNSTYDNQFDPSIIPVENIARIKITEGPSSVLYGAGGNAGIINIITKKGTPGLHGSLEAQVSEGPANREQATLSSGTENLRIFLGASRYSQDSFRLSSDFDETVEEGGGKRENSDKDLNSIFANMVYDPSTATQIGLTLSYTETEYGIPPITNPSRDDPFQSSSAKYDRIDDGTGYSAQLALRHKFESPLELRSWIFVNQSDEECNRYDDSTYTSIVARNSFSQDSETSIYGGNIQLKYDLQTAGTATLALGAREESWKTDLMEVTRDGEEYSDDDKTNNIYSAALEYEVSPLDNLGVVIGYGYHYQIRDDVDTADVDTREQESSYLIGASYDLGETTRIKLSHAKKIRFPSIRQLYDGDDANPALTAETCYHYELGLDQELMDGETLLSLNTFIINAKDYIEKDNITEVQLNYESYRLRGFELELETQALDNLLFKAGYTYMFTRDLTSDSERDELQHRPQDKLTLEGTYTTGFGLKVYASYLYIANQYYYSKEEPLEKAKLNNINVVNVRFSQQLIREHLEMYAGATNLLDVDYEESYGIPQPGRTAYIGLKTSF